MVGQPLRSLGWGTGLCRVPPYVAVKVPVFSFAKITDANASLSPEMKSTGEVLGVGKNLREALYKGLVSAGYRLDKPGRGGVLISVNRRDQPEVVHIARKLDDMTSTDVQSISPCPTLQPERSLQTPSRCQR